MVNFGKFAQIGSLLFDGKIKYTVLIININGPINSGKTTVSTILAEQVNNSLFIEVDELISDEESQNIDLKTGWALRLEKLDKLLDQHILDNQYDVIIFAYPASEKNFKRWEALIAGRVDFEVITLAPNKELCLTNRGERELNNWEKQRINEMYQEGYSSPVFPSKIIDNSSQTPSETVTEIINYLGFRV